MLRWMILSAVLLLYTAAVYSAEPIECRVTEDKIIEVKYDDGTYLHSCATIPPPVPDKVFEEIDGHVTITATDYYLNLRLKDHQWIRVDNFLRAEPNTATDTDRLEDISGAHVAYRVKFNQPGDYFVWIRGAGVTGEDDSVHFGLDGVLSGTMDFFGMSSLGFTNLARNGSPAKINVPTAGEHTFHIWMREDGFFFDEIQINRDADYRP